MPPKRYQQPKKSRVELEITTTQKVMVGVALLASIGAFAAGFAAIPNPNCNKGDKDCFAKMGQTVQRTMQRTMQKTLQPTSQPTVQAIIPNGITKTIHATSITKVRPGSLVVMKEDSRNKTIYYKSTDNKLTPFESLEVFYSWSSVIPANKTLVTLPIAEITANLSGKRILLRPASRMVTEKDGGPILYVCAKDGLCRISDAVTAQKLFGDDWNNSAFFVKLTPSESGLYKKIKSLSQSSSLTGYTQAELFAQYPSIETYLGL